MSNKKHIVYLGCSGFPYGMAEVQKIILISKGLIDSGNTVTVICRRGLHSVSTHPDLATTGNYEGINYIYTSGSPFRSNSFFVRNFLKVKAVVNEFSTLIKMRKNNKLDYAILSSNRYFAILYFVFLSKIFKFKTIFNYVEYYPGQKKEWYRFGKKLNDILFDKYGPQHVDVVLPISEFLINNFQKAVPQKKYLKIPVLTDLTRYDGIEISNGQKYFIYCGDAAYNEIIKFIIDSFEMLKASTTFLHLVINGMEKDMQEVRDYIENSSVKDRIRIFSKLSDKALSGQYKNALALLIPLRPTLQDKARFPHKIGEYLASGNPVVSTNYGEVTYYFKDMENMLIADSYDVSLFSAKMQFVLDNPAVAREIGIKGKKIVSDIFDYRAMGKVMNEFLDSEI